MKVHTSDFKNNIKLMGRELSSKITYTLNDEEIELTSEDLNSISPHYKSSILKSAMKQLDVDSNVMIPEGTVINYQFGLKIGNSYEYLDYGNYVVYKVEEQKDTNSYLITCYDKMLYSMIPYESMNITYPISIRDYLVAICNKIGLQFKNSSDTFANYDKMIQNELYLDSDGNSLEYTFRDVLDELAQVTASTICIDEVTDKLEIKYINETNDTIDEEYLKNVNVNFGKKYGPINSIVLSRSAESDNVYLQDENSIEENGLCEIKIKDNQIMNFNDRSDYLVDILDVLDGLEYYLNDFSSTGIFYYDLCDKYGVQIGNDIYSCIMFNNEANITQGAEENIHTDLPEESETDYTKADKTDRRINQTQLMVDKQNGIIQSLVTNTTYISDIKSGIGSITLENAHEGQLYQLSIKGNISLLFPQTKTEYGGVLVPDETLTPSDELVPNSPVPYGNEINYPSNNFYSKNSKLLIDETEYELDLDFLNYMNTTVCDEFVYDNGICYIIRRVGIDEDGNMYALENEFIESKKGIVLDVKANSTISLQSFPNAILKATYLLENVFTDNFATEVYVQSSITQTADSITSMVSANFETIENAEEHYSQIQQTTDGISLEVANKVGDDEVISKINQSAESVSISANKININGVISANGNFSVDTNGNMSANNGSFSGNITGGSINVTAGASSSNPYILITHPDSTGYEPKVTRIWGNGLSVSDYSMYNSPDAVIRTECGSGYAELNNTVVNAFGFNNISLESKKENFEKIKNATEILKNGDIYKYNYKGQEQKCIGFVIADEGGDFKTPNEVINKDGNAIDIYSMTSILWQAVKEQQEKIEQLETKINLLESESEK